jgi:exodeoxyribonuclease VII small subunit
MSAPEQPQEQPPAAAADSFEQGLEQLELIVKEMERGDITLERSMELFEKGMALSAGCRKQLEEAETRIEMLTRKGGVEPFPPPAR